jgi:hypothetical protein
MYVFLWNHKDSICLYALWRNIKLSMHIKDEETPLLLRPSLALPLHTRVGFLSLIQTILYERAPGRSICLPTSNTQFCYLYSAD